MDLSVIVLLSLCGFLRGQETTDPISLDDCCKDGKERGQESQDCTSLPLISESTTCRIAQEQCCTAVLEDNICTSGINVAKDQGSCDALLSSSTCETKTAKTCCECCLLGRAAQERGLSCDLTLAVWYQCGLVSRACCVDRSPNSDGKPAPELPKAQGDAQNTEDQCKAAGCSQSCFNGSCACLEGYKLKADAKTCEDINECLSVTGPCPSGHMCFNTVGSYTCQRHSVTCGRGYHLNADGSRCVDIDECALPTGGHICSYRCHNTPGSFLCTCPATGYTLAPNGRSCQDIDECVTSTHSCSESESCFNIQGGYKCLNFDCPANYRRSGDTRCERLPCNQTSECLALPVRITYYHLTFPTKIPIPTNIFRMGPSNSALGDDIEVAIVDGNQGGYFAAKRVEQGGVLVVQKPIALPQDFEISLEMKLRRFGHLSVYLFKIRLFVTPDELSHISE
uniref:Fibulin 1 n=1 Tax=Cyprinus carpio TaxID=7962 RepID=A0A8C2KSH1_CYPCA